MLWRWWSLSAVLFVFLSRLTPAVPLSRTALIALREETRAAFFHSYDAYLTHAYPHDELKPLSCAPRTHLNKTRGTLDDVLGGFMLTLVDSLDMLLLMREYERFSEAVEMMKKELTFDRDVSVSVFETNIRILGGLLSAHQIALSLRHAHNISYDGEFLLDKAVDLADRLLPAFDTKTGIPYHVVNLRYGVLTDEVSSKTCPAAGASFLLEMGLLSRLTGDWIYADKAHRAIQAIWSRRSKLDLVGAMIDVQTGKWLQTHSGIGAGIDSFYEIIFKSYVLFGDTELHLAFTEAYEATKKHLMVEGWHVEVDMHRGIDKIYSYYFSALQAFWPSLQVSAGHVKDTFHNMAKLWHENKALPDIYDHQRGNILGYARDYPLRPEMVESAYHLYKATKDKKYLKFGKDFLHSLQVANKVKCGYAASKNVVASAGQLYHSRKNGNSETMKTKFLSSYKKSKLLDDRMDSYFLSETLKYLFLLFDEALPVEERASFFCGSDSINLQPSTGRLYAKSAPLLQNQTQPSQSIPQFNSEAFDYYNMDDSLTEYSTCIDMNHVVFTTEGHIFLNSAELRKRDDNECDWRGSLDCGESFSLSRSGNTDHEIFSCPAYISTY